MHDIGSQPDPGNPSGVRETLRFLTHPANLLVFTSDQQGLLSFVSPSWSAFTGRPSAQELGTGWLDRVHPEDLPALTRGLAQARQDSQSFRLMFRYQRDDGVYRWLLSQGMPLTAPDGEFTGHLALCFDVTPYQEGEAEMEQAVLSVFPLLKQTRLIAVVLDTQGRVLFSNGSLGRLLQCSATELISCPLFERHLAAGDRALLERLYPEGGQNPLFPAEFQSELVTTDQQTRLVFWHAVVWRDVNGRLKGAILIGDDVTEVRREEEQTSLYVKAFEATNHAIVVTDAGGTILSINRAFTALTGYRADEAIGANPRLLQSGRHDEAFYKAMWASLLGHGHWHGDMWDRHKDGHLYPKYLAISAIRNDSHAVTHYVGIFYDNSERKTIEERLDHLAHYDALTGLPNRSLLMDRLEQAIERARRLGIEVALLYIDLDHFKLVNDDHGHSAGDQLLKTVAQRMRACVRGVDTVARLGGDEFVVLLPDTSGSDDVLTVARKLLIELSHPYDVQGHRATCTPSIGISVFPQDSHNPDELVAHADTAMYQAKQGGRASFRVFHEVPD